MAGRRLAWEGHRAAATRVRRQDLRTLSQARSLSHWLVLGAISWAFIAIRYQKFQKLTFDGGSKGLAWIKVASRHHVPLKRSRRSILVNYFDGSDSAFSVTWPPIQSPSKITKLVVNDYAWFRAQGVDRAALADVCVVCGVWCVVCGVWCVVCVVCGV